MSDNVEHPNHYNAGSVETIEGIKAALGDGFSDYCLGNVLKYVWRCKHKGKLLEDLRKASKYLEWAIEAAESEKPNEPQLLAIPDGWRELEPDEMPLATDMHEWMGGWFYRNDDATHEYKWHSHRHIRKIETANTSEAPNSSNWIPKVGDNVRVNCPRRTFDGKVGVIVEGNAGRYAVRLDSENLTATNLEAEHLELIEAAKPSETPNSSIAEPLAIPEGWRELEPDEMPKVTDLYENEGVWRNRINDSSIEYARYEVRHIRKIETANPSEAPNSSIPDPGPGYRLLSKEPPEQVIRGDEYWHNFNSKWVESENFIHEGGPQSPELYYRRKIEPTAWIPKVGDKVRLRVPVLYPTRDSCNYEGRVTEISQSGRYTIFFASEDQRIRGWVKPKDLHLIEAAS